MRNPVVIPRIGLAILMLSRKKISLLSFAFALSVARAEDNPSAHEARIGWWREARFGMFVHWGPSSVLGGIWRGKPYSGYAEHIQRMAKISMADYRREAVEKFNPTEFNADTWVSLAKAAGMGYFVITAKHHDGFAMYDSQVSAYNVVKATPFARDPMQELRAACRKHGIKFGFYYSHAFDWGDANAPGNDWEWQNPGGDRMLHGAEWWLKYPEFLSTARRYVDEKSIPQILELIRGYDPDILWFDTPTKLPAAENVRILAAVRQANPNIVVNSRIFSSAWTDLLPLTDYRNTVDRPAEFPARDGDWEGIPTTNESYGYNQNDQSHKPPGFFIRLLAKAAARGGNTLLNIGPMGTGAVDPKDVAILQGIATWWTVNGESIRGTTRTPLPMPAWGESTRKGNIIYLHVFEWPRDGRLIVGGLMTEVRSARILGQPSTRLSSNRLNDLDLVISGLPEHAPNADDTVIALETVATPQGDATRLLSTTIETDTLRSFDARLTGKLQLGTGKRIDAWVNNWKRLDDAVIWPVRINERATFEVSLVYDAPNDTARNRLVEGDEGKELLLAGKGAGGRYTVQIGRETFRRAVRVGINVNEPLGRVTLEPGSFEFRVGADKIVGEELFRLRSLVLKPVKP